MASLRKSYCLFIRSLKANSLKSRDFSTSLKRWTVLSSNIRALDSKGNSETIFLRSLFSSTSGTTKPESAEQQHEESKKEEQQQTKKEEPSENEKKLQDENKKLVEEIKVIDSRKPSKGHIWMPFRKTLHNLWTATTTSKVYKEKYKRALAENENIRQRMRKEIEAAKIFGIQSFSKDLLDVADVLERATASVPQEVLKGGKDVDAATLVSNLSSLFQGLKMTESQLQTVFRQHGLTKINPIGEKFDPSQHQAIFQQETKSLEPGTVAAVTKIGYKLQDRVIRPALVGVAKKPPTPSSESSSTPSSDHSTIPSSTST